MALALLVNGALAGIGDVNQYYNLLTGVTHDQATKLDYRPGAGTTPTLTLDGDGHGPLIKGFKTDHTTQAFQIDANGNLAIAGALTVTGNSQAAGYYGPSGAAALIAVYDGALGTIRLVKFYEGTPDPTTYDTVPEGSWWLKG